MGPAMKAVMLDVPEHILGWRRKTGAAWGRRVVDPVEMPDGAIPVFVVSREDLIRSKHEAGRPKDLDDLEHLEPS